MVYHVRSGRGRGGFTPRRVHLPVVRVIRAVRGLKSYVSVRLCDLCVSVFLFRLRALHV
jgi:hypothetical protein